MVHSAGKAVGLSRRVEPDRQRAAVLNRRAMAAGSRAEKSNVVFPPSIPVLISAKVGHHLNTGAGFRSAELAWPLPY